MKKAFSLIEVLVVLAIVAIITGIVFSNFGESRSKNVLDKTTQSIAAFIEETRALSLSARDGYKYGVRFATSTLVRFRGDTYISGAQSNKIYDFDDSVLISTTSLANSGYDLIFDKLKGIPNTSGTLYITQNGITDVKKIYINANGVVEVF